MSKTCFFVGTPLELTEQEAYHLQKYSKKGRASGQIVRIDAPHLPHAFEIDTAALATPVLLDCGRCHQAHAESCCEGGFPFPPTEDLLPVLDLFSPLIADRYLDAAAQRQIREQGLFAAHLETAGHPTIATAAGGNCLFCRVEGEGPACAAHRFALEQGRGPHELKPLSCLLYPLDLIEGADGTVLLTALTADTARFSRWGEDYRLDFLCANLALRERVAAGETDDLRPNIRRDLDEQSFARERYRPAYLEGRETLIARYGLELYKEIESLMGGKS